MSGATRTDVAIIGGGPAGLAAAIELARRGVPVRVFERQGQSPDKACGEGLMPVGAAWLDARGVTARLDRAWCSPFAGIRYVQGEDVRVAARFRCGTGLGVRRTALMAALEGVAAAAGVRVEYGVEARVEGQDGSGVRLMANGSPLEARFVVAADGLASPTRGTLGLEGPPAKARRFGQRRHFADVETGEYVEVHWTDGVEAYLTPTGPGHCGVALLWDIEALGKASFEELLGRFPGLASRFSSKVPLSDVRGAGPLWRSASGVVAGRAILLGDAAGYVDAITGEGLSLAFACAEALGAALPHALSGRPDALDDFARLHRRLFRRYARSAGALLWLSQHPRWRRRIFSTVQRVPTLFERALELVDG